MAKSAKYAKNDRQAKIDAIRKKQRGSEKRRGLAIVLVCALIALLIVGAAAYRPIKNALDSRKYSDVALADLGGPASDCQKVTTKSANGSGNHVPETQQVDYTQAPPAFGPHWNVLGLAPVPIGREFYTAADRPELEQLVHNLEHGFTILWYDDTVADDADQVSTLRAIAAKFSDTSDRRNAFIVAPWTSDDENGKSFPKGQHIAMTHWSAGGVGVTDTTKQVGVWQYCSQPSGAALETFMKDYPQQDSPEPSVQM
ncbi:DUF3105 domain-containing protein [Nocardioides acrostichi]|uniref:DUF3105 domain-containing protein n=1 Tax=Nocardioides acrostichi TaxID=2784339 RepID=A0A930V0Y0_9ACTN|nr:DUF3105 domain-containing protein [Nocardioides acrostichi]MBF4161851.1 DUF3105 domain-containing protein [Nocardioides acrostichi]